MTVKVRLFDSQAARQRGEATTVHLSQALVDKTREVTTGRGERPDANLSHDDVVALLETAASSGFQHRAQLSADELTFFGWIEGAGSDRRSHASLQIVATGEELRVQTSEGRHSGETAVARGHEVWLRTLGAPLLQAVQDLAEQEFGHRPEFNPDGMKIVVRSYRTPVRAPPDLDALVNRVLAEEAKGVRGSRPLAYEPAQLLHDHTSDYGGQLVTSPSAHLRLAPLMLRDGHSTFVGSATEAELAKVVRQLGGDDWKITNYQISDGSETSEVGALIYSRQLQLVVRFGFWERT